jgi:hypothetical protein
MLLLGGLRETNLLSATHERVAEGVQLADLVHSLPMVRENASAAIVEPPEKPGRAAEAAGSYLGGMWCPGCGTPAPRSLYDCRSHDHSCCVLRHPRQLAATARSRCLIYRASCRRKLAIDKSRIKRYISGICKGVGVRQRRLAGSLNRVAACRGLPETCHS